MPKSKLTVTASLAALATVALCAGGCADKNMMAEAACRKSMAEYHPGTGELYRLYEYYPNQEIYYSVFSYHYYWRDGEKWRHGPDLPAGTTVSHHEAKLIELPTGKPFTMHEDVLAMYPSLDQLRMLAAETQTDATGETTGQTFATVPTDR